MIDTTIAGIEAKRQQAATIGQLASELVDALDCGNTTLVKALDRAISRALESPEAAASEQAQLDQRDPH